MAKLYNWENRICPFVFKGPVSDIQYECLLKFCNAYNIFTHGYHFNSNTDVYGIRYYKEQWHIVMDDILFYDIANIVDPLTFIIRCLNGPEKQWFEDLNVGDTITIDNLEYNSNVPIWGLYPVGINEFMAGASGQNFIIRGKFSNDAIDPYAVKFNGDMNIYILTDSPNGWHSSMFVPASNNKNLVKLLLSNIELKI